MRRFEFLTRSFKALALAAVLAPLINHANAERIFYDSFEAADSNGDPFDWETSGHPSYLGVATENNIWTTPYGTRGMTTYSNGIGTRTITFLPLVSGNYIVKFNISSSEAIGEYRAELWSDHTFFGRTLLASVEGDTNGSKNMTFSREITWRHDPAVTFLDGAELELKLMQDPNRSNWRHTPIWDNVSVDWVPDVDTTGPTVANITDDKEGGTVAPNTLVTYTVTFSEDMNTSSVNASDFGNAGSANILTPLVEQVSPQVFLVKVTPTNDGTLRLRINQSALLEDALFNDMITSSAIEDNVSITVDGTNPILLPSNIVDNKGGSSVSPGTLVTYTLTFSKDMNDQSVTSADFENSGSALISFGTITETSLTSGIFTVPVTPTGPGTLRLTVKSTAILLSQDGGQLDADPVIADDTIISVDGVPPTLTDITDDAEGSPVTVGTLLTYDVFFSEDMDAATVSASDFGNAVAVGNAPFTINSVQEASPGVFRIELTPTGTGTIQLKINAGVVLQDVPGNSLVTTPEIIDDATVTVEAGSPYQSWSGGLAFEEDGNDDGVDNGMAWLLGADTPSANAIPRLPLSSQSVGNLVLNFTCLKIANRGTAVLKLQYSRDLGFSDAWTSHELVVPDTAGTVGSVIFAIPSTNADPTLVNLQATIPASAATPGTKLFARLKATP